MGQAKTDPVDYARLIVLDHLTSECCKASRSAKSEVITMSNEIRRDNQRVSFDEPIKPRARSFESEDEGSVLATILVMVICVVFSVAIVNWFIFHY